MNQYVADVREDRFRHAAERQRALEIEERQHQLTLEIQLRQQELAMQDKIKMTDMLRRDMQAMANLQVKAAILEQQLAYAKLQQTTPSQVHRGNVMTSLHYETQTQPQGCVTPVTSADYKLIAQLPVTDT